MRNLFKKITLLLALFLLMIVASEVKAHDDHLRGWAWSPNFGWVSFNCDNTGSYTCEDVSYAVEIDRTTGDLSGYAWSENVGWISFQENNYPSNSVGDCTTSSSCLSNDQNNCSSCYNFRDASYPINGWAKILAWGEEGWIKLDNGRTGFEVTIDATTGYLHGFAYSGYDQGGSSDPDIGMGWLSFNCADTPDGCGAVGYRVFGTFITESLSVLEMSAPNWSPEESCSVYGSLQAFLEWEVEEGSSGGCAVAYQILVNDNNSTSTPILDTGKCQGTFSAENGCTGGYDGAACQANVDSNRFNLRAALKNGGASSTAELEYSTPYTWWLKVWDELDVESSWYQFDVNTIGVLTNGQTENASESTIPNLTFTTYYHKFPNPSFSWAPTYPNIGENVYFQDSSKYYQQANPGTPLECNDTDCSYSWVFSQAVPSTSSTRNPSEIKFLQGGSMNVGVTVVDQDGYSCSNSADVENVSICLPLWQEKSP